MISDDEFSPLVKRYKADNTSDLDISPILTDLSQDKSVDFNRIQRKKLSFSFSSIEETKVLGFFPERR